MHHRLWHDLGKSKHVRKVWTTITKSQSSSRLRLGDVRRRLCARYQSNLAVSEKESSARPGRDVAKTIAHLLNSQQEQSPTHKVTFGVEEMRNARLYLSDIVNRQRCTEPHVINQAFSVLERVITEISILIDKKNGHGDGAEPPIDWWFCDHRTFNPLLNLWKQSVKTNSHLKPKQLLFRLIVLTRKLPYHFYLNHMTVSILLEAVILTERRKLAPEIVEEILEILQNELPPNQRHRVHPPNEYVYTQLLLAWSNSGLPNAEEMVKRICHNMRQDEIPFTIVTYGVLIRFYGKLRDTQKLDQLFNAMKMEKETSTKDSQMAHPNTHLQPNLVTLSEAIYGYSTGDRIEKAEQIIRQMHLIKPTTVHEEQLFGRSIQCVLAAYRYTYNNPLCASRTRHMAVQNASKFYERNKDCPYLSDQQKFEIAATMMDIFAHAGKHERVEELYYRFPPRTKSANILIKAYGRDNLPERATTFLKENMLLQNDESTNSLAPNPDRFTFTAVIDCWAESDRPDAVENALDLVRLLKDNPTCRSLGLRPDVSTFTAVLKCISKSDSPNSGRRAVRILDEMERLFLQGDEDVKPRTITYCMVIKSCMHSKNYDLAEKIVERMEKTDTPPNIRMYTECFLHYWSKQSCDNPEAALRAEGILDRLREASKPKDHNPNLVPNVYSYNSVMTAWARSGSPTAADRMWDIYRKMTRRDKIQPDNVTFTTLISFFTKSNERSLVQRAESLLQIMETSANPSVKPDHRHYEPIMEAWLKLGEPTSARRVLGFRINSFVASKNKYAKPGPKNYDDVMHAFLKAGNVHEATMFINKIQNLKDENLLPDGPCLGTYKVLLAAWKESPNHPSTERSIAKIETIISNLLERQTYKLPSNAIALPEKHSEALETA